MTSRPSLLSLTTMHQAGLQILREATELRMASALDPATLQREVVGADALIIRTGGVVDAALLDRGDKLKVVGRHGVGYDQIDVEAATARGIQVVYTPGANTQSVAEHVFRTVDRPFAALSQNERRVDRRQLPRSDQHDRTRDCRQDSRESSGSAGSAGWWRRSVIAGSE